MSEILAAYALVGGITFLLYAVDQRAARRGTRRLRERTLQLWAWAGGFAGAIAAQALLRHKTRHPSMVLGAWLALGVHAAAWAWGLSGGWGR